VHKSELSRPQTIGLYGALWFAAWQATTEETMKTTISELDPETRENAKNTRKR